MTLVHSGQVARVGEPVRLFDVGEGPMVITTGPDGSLWCTSRSDALVRITDDGVTEFPLPDRTARPHAVAADPAGGCWFTEWGAWWCAKTEPWR
ncbi:virginiamycin B lyase family protein [Amycolatopsis bartoniae]|nr:hypothetical protein [Amycolatopsis bartoniae]